MLARAAATSHAVMASQACECRSTRATATTVKNKETIRASVVLWAGSLGKAWVDASAARGLLTYPSATVASCSHIDLIVRPVEVFVLDDFGGAPLFARSN
jgi:hypothetical protein